MTNEMNKTSDDIKKLIERLRATYFEVRDFSLHDVRDAANALEAMIGELEAYESARVTWMTMMREWINRAVAAEAECDRLKDEVERLRGEQRLKSLIGPSESAVERIIAERDRLKDEVERLRELVEGMEEELKEIGAVSWRTPDEKALDADLMREDAHERRRIEKEYPWKE